MNGIMVTLLMFLTTGIVVGQQSNSPSNSFNSNPASVQNDLLKPLEIGVSADAIRAIRDGKVLVSKIEPIDPTTGEKLHRNVISGVSLFQEGKNLNTLNKTTVRGTDNGDGVLRFGLTESDLNALDNNQLKMDFGASQRGKYQEIEVFFVPQNRNTGIATSRPNTTGNGFNTSRPAPDNTRPSSNQLAFGPRGNRAETTSPIFTPYIPLPAPAEPGDSNFMGPTLPAAGNWTSPNQQTQRNLAFTQSQPHEFASNQDNNQNNGRWSLPNRNDSVFPNLTVQNQQDDRQGEIDQMKARWAAEKQKLDYENMVLRLEAENAKQQEEQFQWAQARAQQNQFETNQARTAAVPTLNGLSEFERLRMNRLVRTPEEIAYNNMMRELERKAEQLESQEASLSRKTNLLELKEDQLDATMRELTRHTVSAGNPSLRTSMPWNVNPNYDPSYQNDLGEHYYPHNNRTGPAVDRAQSPYEARGNVSARDSGLRPPNENRDIAAGLAVTPKGIKDYTTSITGPEPSSETSSTARDDRVNGFVLFLLFCSLGLNIYLSFISRGFHVRYIELADELRETFSTTH